jgi:hypothetical protein
MGTAISVCVRAVHAGERLKEGRGTSKRGPQNRDTHARASNGPGHRQGGPTGQREKVGKLTGHGAGRTGPRGGESGEGGRRARASGPSGPKGRKLVFFGFHI